MSFSAVSVVATLSHCSTHLSPLSLPSFSNCPCHTHALALLRTSLLSFYLCHSCFGALILTAVDMHIMGIERFLFCFSSLLLAFSHSLPFFLLAAACPLGYRAIGFRLGFRQFSVCVLSILLLHDILLHLKSLRFSFICYI